MPKSGVLILLSLPQRKLESSIMHEHKNISNFKLQFLKKKKRKQINQFLPPLQFITLFCLVGDQGNKLYEPRRKKTGLQGFRPGPTQTSLYKHRKELEA